MNIPEQIQRLTESQETTDRLMRQGFQVLTDLHAETERAHAETERALQRMEKGLSHLLSIAADHEQRIRKLEE